MNVLFICSQNDQRYDIAPFIKAQGDSLFREGVDLSYFLVKGKGLLNYLSNVPRLRRYLQEHEIDVIHAHYSLCGMVALLATRRIPVIISFMGDDVLGTADHRGRFTIKSRLIVQIARILEPFAKGLIAKSPNIYAKIHRKSIAHLVPNGVELSKFKIEPADYRRQLGLAADKQYVLFLASPKDPNKNVALARKALHLISRPEVELLTVSQVPHEQVQAYLHAADVVVLCSYSEGSPNVVKEAMACNRPIVATRVGDVEQVIGHTLGCYLSSHDPADFAQQLVQALAFARERGVTEGRQALIDQGLDSRTIAWRLIAIYNRVCKSQKKVIKRPDSLKRRKKIQLN